MKGRITVLMFVVLLLAAVPAVAGTIMVDAANMSGIEDGTVANPYNTIQEGLNAAVENDIVSVAPGIYHGAIVLKNNVKLVSQQGPSVTFIDGMGAYEAVRQPYTLASNTHIEGFTIYGSTIGVYVTNRVSFWAYSSAVIDNCVIKDASIGVNCYPSSNVTIRRSVIYWSNTAVDSIWSSPPKLHNVTIDFVTTAVNMYQNSVNMSNTIITNTGTMFATWGHRGTGYVWGSNNDLWRNTTVSRPNWDGRYPTLALTNGLAVDPLYVAMLPHGVDYHLQDGSPLVDQGIDLGLPFNGAAPDIGAYETDYADLVDMVEALAESYSEMPAAAFKNAGEQRRHALNNKIMEVLKKLDSIADTMTDDEKLTIYTECLNKVQKDIWAKADGFYGGNPKNDWIVTQEEQDLLYPRIQEIISTIEEEMQLLQGGV